MERQSVSAGVVLLCGISLWMAATARADLMTFWGFGPDADGYTEDVTAENVIGTPTLILRLGEKDVNGKEGVDYTDAEGTYHPEGRAGAWDNVTGDSEWVMTVNTVNWHDLSIRWDYNSENDIVGGDLGPESFDFDYRVGGAGQQWIEILNNQPVTRDDAWHEFSYNLWLISAIENQPIVEFRVRDLNQGTESGGNFKIDNLQLTGTTSSTISLLTPNGGERLIAGSTYDVTWQTSGTIADVFIEYSTNDANDWTDIDTVANTGLYEWEVPDANSPRCLARVSDMENHNVNDTSDDLFEIYKCTLSYDLNRDCFVDMLDFALLVSEWLQCGDPFDPDCLQ